MQRNSNELEEYEDIEETEPEHVTFVEFLGAIGNAIAVGISGRCEAVVDRFDIALAALLRLFGKVYLRTLICLYTVIVFAAGVGAGYLIFRQVSERHHAVDRAQTDVGGRRLAPGGKDRPPENPERDRSEAPTAAAWKDPQVLSH
jgi:hypothetical protein